MLDIKVLIYSLLKNCGHCVQFKPHFHDAAATLQDQVKGSTKYHFAQVDADENHGIVYFINVSKYL